MKIKNKPNMLIKLIQKIKIPIFYIILAVSASNVYAINSSETLVKSQANPQLISKELKLANNEYSQEEVKKTINDASIEAKKSQEDARKSLLEANKIVQKSNSSELIKIAKNRANIEQSRKDVAKLQLLLANNLQKNQ